MTAQEIRRIRGLYLKGISQEFLGEWFGYSRTTITDVVAGHTVACRVLGLGDISRGRGRPAGGSRRC